MAYKHNKQWRESNPKQRGAHRALNYAQGRKHATPGRKPWTAPEDTLVLEFKGIDRDLSAKISRSVQAIQIRRSRLKKSLP